MALTAAEKQKRYRDKLKNNPQKHEEAKKSTGETYACKALTDIEEDGEVKVVFLRVVDENAKRFRIDEKDISYVDFDDIMQKLPSPDMIKRGHRTYYEFKESVNVFEKK